MNQNRKTTFKKIAYVVLIIILVIAFFYSVTFWSAYKEFISKLQSLMTENHFLGIVAFIAIESISVMIAMFSSVPFGIAAISIWGKLNTFTYSMIGGMIGASIGYFIGAHALYLLIKKIIPAKEIEYYRKTIATKSSFWLILLFRLAVPVEISNYALGIIKYPFGKYLLATAIAYLPFYIITIFASQAFINQTIWMLISLILLNLVFFLVFVYLFLKNIKKK